MVIAIDFDGTITEYRNGPIRQDFLEYVWLLAKENTLILNTSRTGKYRVEAVKMLQYLPIRTNVRVKPKADLYIDDKNIFCEEINWKKIYNFIQNLKKNNV